TRREMFDLRRPVRATATEAVHEDDRQRSRPGERVAQSHAAPPSGRSASGLRLAVCLGVTVLAVAIAIGVLGYALYGADPLALLGLEDAYALRVARGDANVVDRATDQLAGVGDEHDLVAVLDWEGGHQPAIALVDDHGGDAFAAAAGDAVIEGGRA